MHRHVEAVQLVRAVEREARNAVLDREHNRFEVHQATSPLMPGRSDMNPALHDAEAAQATEDLRERLEELRDALLANNLAEAKEMLPKVEKAYRRCRSSYQTDAQNE